MPSSASAFQQIMLILKNWWQESLRALLVRGQHALTYDYNYLPHYLCRSIQSRNYLHNCSLRYCLQRSTCRFFFPGPKTPQRRLQCDDRWVIPHYDNSEIQVRGTPHHHILSQHMLRLPSPTTFCYMILDEDVRTALVEFVSERRLAITSGMRV